ncbi:MAG: ABC transporter substrate-binding protein [Anaerolineae bacterium]|nr:ABC transporter substrate-binding protein [Anaerolineae bacterium]
MKNCRQYEGEQHRRQRLAQRENRWASAGGWLVARLSARAGLVGTLLALAVGLCLAGCGSPEAAPAPPPAGPTPTVTVPVEMPVVIAITGAFDDQTLATLDRQISAFEQTNPDILVEVVNARGTEQERQMGFAEALAQGDSSRDIYVVDYHWLAGFSTPGWLRPLDGLFDGQGLDLDSFLPPAVDASQGDGDLLAIPWTVDAGLLYYRLDQLDQPPATWPELEQAALEPAQPAGLPYGFVWPGATGDTLACITLEFVWAYGGDVLGPTGDVVFDSPAARAALQQMLGLVNTGASPQQVIAYTEAATLEVFQSGKALMMRNWASAWEGLNAPGSALVGRVAVAPLPASCLGGQGLVLSGSSLHPEQAFQFMAFLASHEQQAQLAREGAALPALESVYHDPVVLAEDPALAELYVGLLAVRPRPKSEDYELLSQAVYTEVHALLAGEQDVETTATSIQNRLEEISH